MYREQIDLQNDKLLDTIFFQKSTRSDEKQIKMHNGLIKYYREVFLRIDVSLYFILLSYF